jgi:hypothetical protein
VNEQPFASPEQAEQLVRGFRPDLRLVRIWPAAGAVSSQVAGIDAEGADGSRCILILRQYGTATVEAVPHIADNEYRLLKLLAALACRFRSLTWSTSRA